jgi:hypothetical protein
MKKTDSVRGCGAANGQFNSPVNAVTLPDGTLVVADSFNALLVVLRVPVPGDSNIDGCACQPPRRCAHRGAGSSTPRGVARGTARPMRRVERLFPSVLGLLLPYTGVLCYAIIFLEVAVTVFAEASEWDFGVAVASLLLGQPISSLYVMVRLAASSLLHRRSDPSEELP